MLILNSPQVVQETTLRWKREVKLAFVPTMGCLHEGHLALVHRAKEYGQKCIVSIFVNPLQFGPSEDFNNYPRPIEEDTEKLKALGADLLFVPTAEDLYPPGFSARIQLRGLTEHLCGRSRPGHFDGVATVVMKLFQIVQPDFAVFGEKDFQQLRVIQQMTADFNLPISILPHPTVRETDGLAYSSRNRYLSPSDRERAGYVPRALSAAQELVRNDGTATVGQTLAEVRKWLAQAAIEVDYLDIAPSATLVPAPHTARLVELASPRLFLAVRVGKTRLIDNGPLGGMHS